MKQVICKLPNCDQPFHALGYCRLRYRRLKANGHPMATKTQMKQYTAPEGEKPKTCTLPLCEEPYYVRGACRAHYEKLMRYGDPYMSMREPAKAGRPKHPKAADESGIFFQPQPGCNCACGQLAIRAIKTNHGHLYLCQQCSDLEDKQVRLACTN